MIDNETAIHQRSNTFVVTMILAIIGHVYVCYFYDGVDVHD